jgi:hypothetical protein
MGGDGGLPLFAFDCSSTDSFELSPGYCQSIGPLSWKTDILMDGGSGLQTELKLELEARPLEEPCLNYLP